MGEARRIVSKTLTTVFGFCALCSVASIHLGESFSVQSLDSFAKQNDIPEEVFEGLPYRDQTKVYKDNLAGFFYSAGALSWRQSRATGKGLFDKDDEKVHAAVASGVTLPFTYVYNLSSLAFSAGANKVLNIDINAYALPAYTADGTCLIKPPKDISQAEFIHQFTNIPDAHITQMKEEVRPMVPIMAHEAKHCELILGRTLKERALDSFVLGEEISADNHAMTYHDVLYPNSDFDQIFLYTRTVSLFSRKHVGDANHATSLALEAFLEQENQPARETVYHNYKHLRELVKRELLDLETDFLDEKGVYYQEVYKVMHKLLESEGLTPEMRRMAELYIEGINVIADKSPLFREAPAVKPQSFVPSIS